MFADMVGFTGKISTPLIENDFFRLPLTHSRFPNSLELGQGTHPGVLVVGNVSDTLNSTGLSDTTGSPH